MRLIEQQMYCVRYGVSKLPMVFEEEGGSYGVWREGG